MERPKKINGYTQSGNAIVSPLPRTGGDFDDNGERSEITSPFTRIKNDLEDLVSELEGNSLSKKSDDDGERTSWDLTKRIDTAQVSFKNKIDSILPRRPSSTHETVTPAPMMDAQVSRSLWIGNLDPTVTEEELRTSFEPYGPIESLRLLPSKECAFVNFQDIGHAVQARERLQGAAIGNMIIRIGYGRAENGLGNSIASGSGSGMGTPSILTNELTRNGPTPLSYATDFAHPATTVSGMAGSVNTKSVWVGQIDPDCTVEMLRDAFGQFGDIESCRVLDAKNCAFVNFAHAADAEVARRAMNGARLGTSTIKTGFAKSAMSGNANSLTTSNVNIPTREEANKSLPLFSFETGDDDQNVSISTQEVSLGEFIQPIPSLPRDLRLSDDLNSAVIRECRRRVEHASASAGEVDAFATQISDQILAASVDPVGNILVQKLIEKGSESTRSAILNILSPFMATVGIHKNGTWVVQKLINHCLTTEQRIHMAHSLRAHIVPLLQDQFGNYVVQCCLPFGPAQNQFIFDALYHRCVDIAMSRFGSRAMRSCLDSAHVSVRQKKFVAMALINHALTLVHDINGVIVIQWLLDSDLPGRQAFIAPVLRGHFASLCLSKHASSVVAKLIQPTSDQTARDLVVEEIFSSNALANLLAEPMAAAIILRSMTTAKAEQRVHMAHQLEPHITKLASKGLPHLQKITEETQAALSLVSLEPANEVPVTGVAHQGPARDKTFKLFAPSAAMAPSLHAVGGPVSNRSAVLRPSTGSQGRSLAPTSNPGRSLAFGTMNTVMPSPAAVLSPEPVSPIVGSGRKVVASDRLSFGPALLYEERSPRHDISTRERLKDRDRPPTPS